MRRLILPYLGFFIAGICLYAFSVWILAGAVLAALFFLFLMKNKTSYIALAIFFLLLGYLSMLVNTGIRNNTFNMLSKMSYFEGMVYDRQGTTFTIINTRESYKIKVYVYGASDIKPGDYVSFKGKIREKRAYEIKGMNASGLDAYVSCQADALKKQQVFAIGSVPVRIRYRLSTALEEIDQTGGAFVSGIVTGQTSGISADEKEAFTNTGLSHILAVSGFNLGIIFYAVLLVFSRTPKRMRYIICILICFVYVFITGFQPSITRAFIMISMVCLGVLLKRDYDSITSIGVSALLMLCYNPYYIYNIGFLLSFGATYGIIMFKDDIIEKLPKWIKKIKDEMSIALAAFLSTLPIIIYSKGYFSSLSIIFNLLVSPFISLITVGSFICSIIYLITGIKVVLYPAVLCGMAMVKLVKAADSFNLMVFPGSPSLWFVAVYYILLLLCFGYIRLGKAGGAAKTGLAAVLLVLLLYKGNALQIHIINVGQGDSIFIETPGGTTALIDTGPAFSGYSAAESRVIPYIRKQGYNSIDTLILTHLHSDHAGGLDYLMENINVGKVISFENPKEENMEYTRAAAGDSISLDGVLLNVIYPETVTAAAGDENECCLVMELSFGEFNMLLTADAEREVMDNLAGDYEVMKLPHHGSGASFSYDMADASNIGSVVVSVGRNSYGHPSPEVLGYLNERGIDTYRTDTMGNIIITTWGKTYRIIPQSP
jgi:competence protein ComEC